MSSATVSSFRYEDDGKVEANDINTYGVLSVSLTVGNFVLAGEIFHEGEPWWRRCRGLGQYLRLALDGHQSLSL